MRRARCKVQGLAWVPALGGPCWCRSVHASEIFASIVRRTHCSIDRGLSRLPFAICSSGDSFCPCHISPFGIIISPGKKRMIFAGKAQEGAGRAQGCIDLDIKVPTVFCFCFFSFPFFLCFSIITTTTTPTPATPATTTYYYLLLLTATYYYLLLLTTTYYYLLLLTTTTTTTTLTTNY